MRFLRQSNSRCLDTSRAAAEFDWRAKTSLRDGLKKTIDWYIASGR